MSPRLLAALTVLGDAGCFLLFALLGMHSHDESLRAYNLARATGTFWVAWLAFAALWGLYSERWPYPASTAWRRVLQAWLPAWLVGLLARSLLFGRPLLPGFASVALITLGIFLLLWRGALAHVLRSRNAKRPAEPQAPNGPARRTGR